MVRLIYNLSDIGRFLQAGDRISCYPCNLSTFLISFAKFDRLVLRKTKRGILLTNTKSTFAFSTIFLKDLALKNLVGFESLLVSTTLRD